MISTGHNNTLLCSIVDREGLTIVRSLHFLRQTLPLSAGDPPQAMPFRVRRTGRHNETDDPSLENVKNGSRVRAGQKKAFLKRR